MKLHGSYLYRNPENYFTNSNHPDVPAEVRISKSENGEFQVCCNDLSANNIVEPDLGDGVAYSGTLRELLQTIPDVLPEIIRAFPNDKVLDGALEDMTRSFLNTMYGYPNDEPDALKPECVYGPALALNAICALPDDLRSQIPGTIKTLANVLSPSGVLPVLGEIALGCHRLAAASIEHPRLLFLDAVAINCKLVDVRVDIDEKNIYTLRAGCDRACHPHVEYMFRADEKEFKETNEYVEMLTKEDWLDVRYLEDFASTVSEAAAKAEELKKVVEREQQAAKNILQEGTEAGELDIDLW